MVFVMIFYLCCLLILIEFVFGARSINCPPNKIKFEKIAGLRPKNIRELLLYQQPHHRPTTLQCLERCAEIEDCTGFILYYKESSCYWYRNEVLSYDELDNIIDGDVSWFIKTCLDVDNCQKRWIFERSPGATLIGNDAKILPSVVTRRECQQSCLDEKTFSCKSVKFTIGHRNGSEALGKCILSDTNRHSMPNSFRVSRSAEEYFDNQCTKDVDDQFCPFEEYDNMTLSHSDVFYEDKSKEDCEHLCQTTKEFNCRGYSIWPISQSINTKYTCLIHSEDSKLLGPKLLLDKIGSTHYERAPCLNISVICTPTEMTIKYVPDINFYGKVYMKGYSENPNCYTKGRGMEILALKISLRIKQCGILQAISNTNSTLFHSTMILQYNNLVQTQADRVIRVGCVFGNITNVVIGTGINFANELPNNGTAIVNSTSDAPAVIMRILDFYTHEEVSETQIGQELELVIEVQSDNDSFDISAGHLIAMTPNSEDSILLLDDRGCPTNLNVFPALTKTSENSVKRLSAVFQAFKFSTSPIIRFSVMVMFCQNECPVVDCGNYNNNRVKRHSPVYTTNGTDVENVNKEEFDKIGREIVREMALELVITVKNPKDLTSDRLIFGESNRVLLADYDVDTQKVCIDYSLFIAFIVLWVLILVIMVVCSLFIVHRYKKYYKNLCIRQSMEELNKNFGLGYSNLENRRVHFANGSDIS